MNCELCNVELPEGEGFPYWWDNGGTAERGFICTKCAKQEVLSFADDLPSPERLERAEAFISKLPLEAAYCNFGHVQFSVAWDCRNCEDGDSKWRRRCYALLDLLYDRIEELEGREKQTGEIPPAFDNQGDPLK